MNEESDAPPLPAGRNGRRWLMLFVGLAALTAGCSFQYGLAYLIPALRQHGFSLELAGILVACPTAGLLLTLIAWGAAADRWGERVVLTAGLGLAGLILLAAAVVPGPAGLGACLVLAGAAGGSVFAASGRLILGWFARSERGLAMGIRQSSQPLGVAIAGLVLPTLDKHELAAPLSFLGAFCLVAAGAVAVLVRDPPRPAPAVPAAPAGPARPAGSKGPAAVPGGPDWGQPRAGSPYRQPVLWRIHAASALLVVPQFTVATFALVYLVDARGWTATDAGRLLAIAQACGAASRLAAGYWSDRVGSRMRPMRLLAVSTGIAMLALAGCAAVSSPAAVAVLVACAVVSVSTNGLAFTAVAEYAGPAWAGRALGVQNTGQNALAAATPPVLAATIGSGGFGASFAVVAALPLIAAALVPVSRERQAGPRAAQADGARASARKRAASGTPRTHQPAPPPGTAPPPGPGTPRPAPPRPAP